MIQYKTKQKRQNKKKAVNRQIQSSALSRPIRLSMLGATISRELDCLINVYAVNGSTSQTFYSFATSTSVPTISQSLTNLCITQFAEFQSLARLYNLYSVKDINMLVTRNSTLLTNTNIAGNLPSIFFQASPNLQPNAVASLTNVALADNSSEYNLATFSSRNYQIMLPPIMVSKSSTANDYFPFGSQTWIPTIYNSVISVPDLYLNLGSLAVPTFQTGAAISAYAVAQVHVKMRVVFAAPTLQ